MNALNNFIARSETIKEFVGPELKPSVAILGSFNSGKSTLLNSLLGDNISPVGTLPTTDCLLYFDYADSFSASYTNGRDKCLFTDRDSLISFLERRPHSGGRVEIKLPSPILRKCRLFDTPGIDASSRESIHLTEQAAGDATRIIYLFHQRGIENFSRLFLYKLASSWKNKNMENISFWLNCTRDCEGTSLENTRVELRKIFLMKVRLNAINILNQENIRQIRLFIDVELARDNFNSLAKKLKEFDSELPARLIKISKIKDDSFFLSEFWPVYETAKKLFNAIQSIHSAPLIAKETEELLSSINSTNLLALESNPIGQKNNLIMTSIKESKELVLELIDDLLNNNELRGLLEHSTLRNLYNEIDQKRFTVAAAGGFSTGKSTFFNALMKEKLLPTGSGPTTSSITRISYGNSKIASVMLPMQVTLPIYESAGGTNLLCHNELNTIEKWLTDENIINLEAFLEGHFRQVDRQELTALINQSKDLFAAGSFAGNNRAPVVFKPVSDRLISRKKLPQKVRITFKNSGLQEFHLSSPASANKFRELINAENAFRIADINIQHPSDFLKIADFIDTPGLDSIQQHHCHEALNSFQLCDACLIFLNARHILHDMDRENLKLILLPKLPGNLNKFFFVINFSDTLTPAQREIVANYVRRNLSNPPTSVIQAIPKPKVFLISALGGLTGQDPGIKILLRHLEEGILRYRGWEFYSSKLNELYKILHDSSDKITYELLNNNQIASERKNKMHRALNMLKQSRGKIKNIRSAIYHLRRS